jgi:hypothetical protein
MQFRIHLVVDQVIIQLLVLCLQKVMVNSIAALDKSRAKLLLFISFLELFSHNEVLFLGGHGSSFDHLRICRMILFFGDFGTQSGNIFCHLVQLLYSQVHNSLETPENIRKYVVAIE